jgi:hypothetical protein
MTNNYNYIYNITNVTANHNSFTRPITVNPKSQNVRFTNLLVQCCTNIHTHIDTHICMYTYRSDLETTCNRFG